MEIKKYYQKMLAVLLLFFVFTGSAQAIGILKATPNPATVFVGIPTNVTFNVTDISNGLPVSGVNVSLSGAGVLTNGTTNAFGTVVINVTATSVGSLGFGTILVIPTKAGFFNIPTFVIAVRRPLIVNATPRFINAGVPTDITINVTTPNATVPGVFDPVSNASVNLTGAGVVDANGTTAANGSVTINVNATSAGIINITANKTGFTNGTGQILVNPLFITANPATVVLNNLTNITLNVTNSTGAPVQGVSVNLSGAGVVDANNITDANGTAVVQVLATSGGTITATANKTGFLNGTATITVTVPQLKINAFPVLIKVSVSKNVSFLVTTANATNPTVFDPVPNASVNVSGAGVVDANNRTNANGIAVIQVHALKEGIITATANKTNFTNGTALIIATMDTLSVTANKTIVQVSNPTFVKFTVKNLTTGVPVANASVNLSGAGVVANGTTDANGTVVLNVTASSGGLINVVASKPFFKNGTAFLVATAPILKVMSITANRTSVQVSNPTPVKFTVKSILTPVDNASVNLSGAGVTANGSTDASGTVVLDVNASFGGMIKAVASKAGFFNATTILIAV